jgi:uncharacterized protein
MSGTLINEVATPSGPARVRQQADDGRPLLVLGHGAGGGIDTPDLRAACLGAADVGWGWALVEQPYRVRGQRPPEPAQRLDAAWTAVVAALGERSALVTGGRSSGARVACRTAVATGAQGVLCLAFPLVTPKTGADRRPELWLPTVPRLVVQGSRDPFGVPAAEQGLDVYVVAGGDHAFRVRRADGRTAPEVADEVRTAVRDWLTAQTPT